MLCDVIPVKWELIVKNPSTMRIIHFLVLVTLTLVACCSTFASAETPIQIKSLTTDSQREVPKEGRRRLKGSSRTADANDAEEERIVPEVVRSASTQEKAFIERFKEFLSKLLGPDVVNKMGSTISRAYTKMGEYGSEALTKMDLYRSKVYQAMGKAGQKLKNSKAVKSMQTLGQKAATRSREFKANAAVRGGELRKDAAAKVGELSKNAAVRGGELRKDAAAKVGELSKNAAAKVGELGKDAAAKVGELGKDAAAKVGVLSENAADGAGKLAAKGADKVSKFAAKTAEEAGKATTRVAKRSGEIRKDALNRVSKGGAYLSKKFGVIATNLKNYGVEQLKAVQKFWKKTLLAKLIARYQGKAVLEPVVVSVKPAKPKDVVRVRPAEVERTRLTLRKPAGREPEVANAAAT